MISVIIAVWNQGVKIQGNFLNLVQILEKLKEHYEIIFINDGSTDNTPKILQKLENCHPNIKIINIKHSGQHPALLEGFKITKGDFVITMDADQKVDPKYIPDLLSELNKGRDMAVCWRAERPGLSLIRRWGSLLVNNYTNFITGTCLHDHACSLKAYQGQFIKDNLSRPGLNKFFGILIARYAGSASEIKVICSFKQDKDSSFTFKRLSLLLFDFILTSFNIQLKNVFIRNGKDIIYK